MPSSKLKTKPKSKPLHEWSFEAIGTQWWIGIYESVAALHLGDLKAAVSKHVELFDASYSRFLPDSWVTLVGARAGEYDLPDDAWPMLELYSELYNTTDGLVTPMVGQLLSDAGYDVDYSLKPGHLRSVPAWTDVVSYDQQALRTTQPCSLDFGAVGKGYLIDILTAKLQQMGINVFCIDGSGDMRSVGMAEPLRIGLEQPLQTDRVVGVATVDNKALCASAPHRRQWEKMHHIMNPHTRQPTTEIAATWVIADTAMLADGLATALFFVPPSRLEQFTFEYLVLYADNSINRSAGFPAELFTSTHA